MSGDEQRLGACVGADVDPLGHPAIDRFPDFHQQGRNVLISSQLEFVDPVEKRRTHHIPHFLVENYTRCVENECTENRPDGREKCGKEQPIHGLVSCEPPE